MVAQTLNHDRARVKRDLLFACLVAVAVHWAILTAPIPRGTSVDRSISQPLSVSIIHPRKATITPPSVTTPNERRLKPYSEPRPKAVQEQTPIQKKRPTHEKTTTKPIKKTEVVRVQKRPNIAKQTPVRSESVPDSNQKESIESIRDSSLAPGPVTADEPMGDGAPVEEEPIAKDIIQNELKPTGAPREGGSGKGIVTYARPKYKENPSPYYPRIARRRGYEGRTLLRVEVLESGNVGQIEIAESSGFDVLDKAALKSVEEWTFIPGTRNGKEIRQWVDVPVRFDLQ